MMSKGDVLEAGVREFIGYLTEDRMELASKEYVVRRLKGILEDAGCAPEEKQDQ